MPLYKAYNYNTNIYSRKTFAVLLKTRKFSPANHFLFTVHVMNSCCHIMTLCPHLLKIILPPVLGLNDELALSQQLHSIVKNVDFPSLLIYFYSLVYYTIPLGTKPLLGTSLFVAGSHCLHYHLNNLKFLNTGKIPAQR